jgi:hypothetical protein
MHDARSFGETSDAARKNDWSLVVAHDRFDAAGSGAMHASGDGGGSGGGGSVSGRILANLLDANLGLHVLGTRTRERILAPGTRLTAVGEAVLERAPRPSISSGSKSDDDAFDSSNASYRVRFRKPSRDFTSDSSRTRRRDDAMDAFTVTNKSFDAFANGFGRAGNAFRALSVLSFVLGFGLSLSRVVRARVVAGREKKFRQRLAAAQAARAENGEPDASGPVAAPGETCVVCLYSRATACYKECGHLVCCEVCAARMQRCPLCRKKSAWMKVYRAGG